MQIEVLGERYQLQDPIGRGGMATIYRGRDLRMDRVVAIKVLREVYSTDPKFVTRFQREAKAASSLQHPNIVQVYDYGQSDGNYFIVMELIEGTDLRRYLRSRGVLAVDRAIIIAHDVALGLGAAHRRAIVHRDVKPQNILVGRDGSIKLTDFGIASVYKDINAERLTTTGMTLGTVQYYAPEQAQGEIVSPAADVYALGIVMYEMLTGRTPFDGDTPVAVAMQHIQDAPTPPSQLNPNIPPALEEIILNCLEKEPGARFRDGSTLARALELLGDEEPGSVSSAATSVMPGGPITPAPPVASSFNNQMGPHSSGVSYPQSGSSPNNRMGGYPTYNPNGQNGMQDGAATVWADQPFASAPPGMMGAEPPAQPGPYANMAAGASDAGSTRPFQKGSVSARAGGTQRDSRFASVITILILLATLLLLGFSIYLASTLGFINLGSQSPSTPTPTATATMVQTVTVPDLTGMTLQQAQDALTKLNLKLQKLKGPDDGVIKDQSIAANTSTNAGTTITVDTEAAVKVPDGLNNNTLAADEQALDQANIKYDIKDDGPDVTQGPNMVVSTDPAAGTILKDGQKVILHVVNYGTPTPVPPPPTAVPTAAPTVAPTKAPTPTVTSSPTATATPKPKRSPTPTVTPSPAASNVTPTVSVTVTASVNS
jgi:eukaryotic-like serine/threonine-protein kinase